MYIYKNHKPLSNRFGADTRLELLMSAGMDGVLGESWEDENGAIVSTGFFTYLLGKPSDGEETDLILRQVCPYCVIPKSAEWEDYLKRYKSTSYERYKMLSPDKFDEEALKKYINILTAPFRIQPVDHMLFNRGIVSAEELNIPHVYGNVEKYLLKGFGFAALDGSRSVSLVSSYIVHNGEAEVDISTRPEYRRRGLAAALCARFILECIERGLTPSWDAQNPESVNLAKKLGFTLDHSYKATVLNLQE